jgi:polar amino acid transport system substrate-binding protein
MNAKNIIMSMVLSVTGFTVAHTAFADAPFKYDMSIEQKDRLRVGPDQKRINEIPKNFKFVEDGVLTVSIGESSFFPLNDFASDQKTIIGYHADLAQLIADSLGRKLKIVPAAWADWPLGLASGKYDISLDNVTVTEQRKEKFDFSTYRKDVAAFFVKRESPIQSINEPKDIAGLRVTTGSGTNFEKIILEWNRINVAAGLKPIEISYYEDESVERLALQSGRVDVKFHANPTQTYQSILGGGATRRVGLVNGGWPLTADNGVVTRKGSGMAEPLTGIINDLIASGVYQKTLERWNLVEEGIERSQTNPPGLPKTKD